MYTIKISCLTKAPQIKPLKISLNGYTIKNIDDSINKKSLEKAVLSHFPLLSFAKTVEFSYESKEFREIFTLKIKSFRKLKKKVAIEGLHKSLYSVEIKEDNAG